MATNLEQHILNVLRGMSAGARPATVNDLSRALGVDAPVIRECITAMVRDGSAEPSMVTVKGVPTLYGLLGQPASARIPAPPGT